MEHIATVLNITKSRFHLNKIEVITLKLKKVRALIGLYGEQERRYIALLNQTLNTMEKDLSFSHSQVKTKRKTLEPQTKK